MGSSVSLLIVSYNGKAFLKDCLASVFAGTRVPDEVIVVDNGSTDGTVPWLAATYPSAICLSQTVNLGFAAANNCAFAHAHGDYLFTLNNDTTLAAHTLASLVAALDDAGERTGAAMGTMVFAHHPEIIACAGIDIYANGVALEAGVGNRYDADALPHPVFGASAGAALFRRTALKDVGFFDPALFMYLEDADLAWRLRLRGWETIAVPQAVVRHVYSGTAGFGSARKAYYLARNRWWCIGKNMPDALVQRCAPAIAAYDAAAQAYALAAGDRASLAGRYAALRDRAAITRAREAVQSRKTATDTEIAAWLRPAPSPLGPLMQRRRLAALIHG
jgi:GT2 family glycosyltransferase